MVLNREKGVLEEEDVPVPDPGEEEVLVRVHACGVCRTDLHILDGELENPKVDLIPGHEIVGTVERCGARVQERREGERVGIPWLGYTCGVCPYCRKERENLCERAEFTGYTRDGGYSEYTVAKAAFCFGVDPEYDPVEAAPLLCAGLIGYRSYRMSGRGIEKLGLYGFGAAAHLLHQLAVHEGKRVFAFTKPGDRKTQDFAREKGAAWAGGSDETPPEILDAAIIFAPVGSLVPKALRDLDKGGVVVCGGIHMSDLPSFPYRILWEERSVRSVANLERKDGREYLQKAPEVPVKPTVHSYPLEKANEALNDLRAGKLTGAAVLSIASR